MTESKATPTPIIKLETNRLNASSFFLGMIIALKYCKVEKLPTIVAAAVKVPKIPIGPGPSNLAKTNIPSIEITWAKPVPVTSVTTFLMKSEPLKMLIVFLV